MKTDTPETDEALSTAECEDDLVMSMRRMERQRDEAREQANDMHEKWLAKGQCCEYLGAELHEAIKQRDRLEEALKKLRNNKSLSLGGAAYEIVEQALQSLPPKP
jgi:uncharacterized coiled-coil DUF342 family protein